VDGIWSVFALLHIPPQDLATCFQAWRQNLAPGTPLILGLVDSNLIHTREVHGWLQQSTPCRFYYHRPGYVAQLLKRAGYTILDCVEDTPPCYTGGHYDELELSAYIITAQAL
jgi:hypothetical protein